MILSDRELWEYINSEKLKIKPLFSDTVRENGLDLRIGSEIARFHNTNKVFDTKNSDVSEFYWIERGDYFVIGPREHVLLHTVEYLELPNDIMGFVNLRSTFARLGLTIPPTIVDAGFRGQLTIELVGSEFPVKLYANQRFLHVVFAKLTTEVEKAYKGKYQGQVGVRLPSFV